MNDFPLVSVLMPVFNVQEYICEAIDSIVNQTYSNIEIIIVDDCSSDGTFRLCEQYATSDERIKLLKNEKNSKICKSLNYGLKYCSGDYILRMDGDDIASLDRIENLLEAIIRSNMDLVSSFTINIDEGGVEKSRTMFPISPGNMKSFYRHISVCSHNWLAKRSVYEVLGGYRNIPSVEDFDFLQRAIDKGFIVGNVPFWGMKIRTRNNNTLSRFGLTQRLSFRFVNKINKNGTDLFSKSLLDSYIAKFQFFQLIHKKSDLYMIKFIETRTAKRYFWLFLSCMLSPFQIEKMYHRSIFKFRMRDVVSSIDKVAPFKEKGGFLDEVR